MHCSLLYAMPNTIEVERMVESVLPSTSLGMCGHEEGRTLYVQHGQGRTCCVTREAGRKQPIRGVVATCRSRQIRPYDQRMIQAASKQFLTVAVSRCTAVTAAVHRAVT